MKEQRYFIQSVENANKKLDAVSANRTDICLEIPSAI